MIAVLLYVQSTFAKGNAKLQSEIKIRRENGRHGRGALIIAVLYAATAQA